MDGEELSPKKNRYRKFGHVALDSFMMAMIFTLGATLIRVNDENINWIALIISNLSTGFILGLMYEYLNINRWRCYDINSMYGRYV